MIRDVARVAHAPMRVGRARLELAGEGPLRDALMRARVRAAAPAHPPDRPRAGAGHGGGRRLGGPGWAVGFG